MRFYRTSPKRVKAKERQIELAGSRTTDLKFDRTEGEKGQTRENVLSKNTKKHIESIDKSEKVMYKFVQN